MAAGSINALIGAQRNASVIDRIANPPSVNPLAGIQAGADAAKTVVGVRQLAAQNAWGQALAAATDPRTGVVDYPGALKSFSTTPYASYGMPGAVSSASPMQNDQVSRAHYQLGIYQGLVGGLPDDASRAQIVAALQRGVPLGLSPTDVGQEIAGMPQNDADLPGFVQQLRASGESGVNQLHMRYGTMEPSTSAAGTTYTPVAPPGKNAPTTFVPAGPAPLSNEWWQTELNIQDPRKTITLPDGTVKENPTYGSTIPVTRQELRTNWGYSVGPNNQLIDPSGKTVTAQPPVVTQTSPTFGTGRPQQKALVGPNAPATAEPPVTFTPPPQAPPPPAPNAAPVGNAPALMAPPAPPSGNPFGVVPGSGPSTTPQSSLGAPSGNQFAGPGVPITERPWTQPPAAVPGGSGNLLAARFGGAAPGGNPFNVVPPGVGTAAPAPAQPPQPSAAPPPRLGTTLSPGETDLMAGKGPFAGENNNSVSAQTQKALLANMRADSARFTGGPGADYDKWFSQFGATWLPSWAQAKLGVNPDDPAYRESFDKMTAQLAMQQQAGAGSGSDYRMGINVEGIPHASQTPEGRDMILAQLQGNADYLQARATLANQWASKSDYPGFQASVRSLDPRVFQYQEMKTDVDPKTGLTQRGKWLSSLPDKDQREIMTHYYWAQKNGVLP